MTRTRPSGSPARASTLRDPLAGQAGAGRGLEDDAVARQQGAGDLPERLGEGRAARADHADERRRARRRSARAWRATSVRLVPTLRPPSTAAPSSAIHLSASIAASSSSAAISARGRPCSATSDVGQLVEVVDHRLRHPAHVAGAVRDTQQRPQRLHLGDSRRPRRSTCAGGGQGDAPQRRAGGRVVRAASRWARVRRGRCSSERDYRPCSPRPRRISSQALGELAPRPRRARRSAAPATPSGSSSWEPEVTGAVDGGSHIRLGPVRVWAPSEAMPEAVRRRARAPVRRAADRARPAASDFGARAR